MTSADGDLRMYDYQECMAITVMRENCILYTCTSVHAHRCRQRSHNMTPAHPVIKLLRGKCLHNAC